MQRLFASGSFQSNNEQRLCSPSRGSQCFVDRFTDKEGADGMMHSEVRPYLMDLGSANGTYLNNERIENERYYELLEKARWSTTLSGA